MKMLAALSFFVCSTVALAQQPEAKPVAKPEVKPTAPAAESKPVARRLGLAKPIVMEKDREVYGAEVTMKDTVALADVIKDPKAYEGKKVKLTAEVFGVCQKKGCWMTVKNGDKTEMVKFKDYKFFVPLDVEGRFATVEAVPQVKVVTEAMRRHYAEDAGKSKEEIMKITGDETQVIFMAEAVELRTKAATAKDDCCEGAVNADGSVKKCCSEGEKKADGAKKCACGGGEKKADGAKKSECCEGEKKADAGKKTEGAKKDDCCEGEVEADGSVKKPVQPAKKDG